jgi:hypothetical protein
MSAIAVSLSPARTAASALRSAMVFNSDAASAFAGAIFSASRSSGIARRSPYNIGRLICGPGSGLPLTHADDPHQVERERIARRVAQQRFESRLGSGQVARVNEGGRALENCHPIRRVSGHEETGTQNDR